MSVSLKGLVMINIQHITLIAVILANISNLIRLLNASVQFIIIVGTPSPAPVQCNYVSPEQVASLK